MNFSERFGFKSIKDKIQDKSMDTDLKNSIWNALKLSYFDIENIGFESYLIQEYDYLFGQIWVNHWHEFSVYHPCHQCHIRVHFQVMHCNHLLVPSRFENRFRPSSNS